MYPAPLGRAGVEGREEIEGAGGDSGMKEATLRHPAEEELDNLGAEHGHFA